MSDAIVQWRAGPGTENGSKPAPKSCWDISLSLRAKSADLDPYGWVIFGMSQCHNINR